MRKNREIIPGIPHQIVVRANNRRRLFSRQWEKDYFQSLLAEASEEHGIPVHALSLLDNHAHLAVTPSSKEATSKFVHSFAQRYAQHHNKLCGGSGKLFEREYGAFPMSTEQSLARQLAYIDFNAVHHGLCRDPADYAWTTYGHHIGRPELSRIRRDLWTPLDWYLGLGEQRCELYRQWVNDCIALDRAEAPPRDFRLRRPNGSRAA